MRQVYELCSTARERPSIGYAGLRLLAIDGTKLALPAYRKLQEHFGCPTHGLGKEQRGPQASLVTLWDVGANQPVSWQLGPYRASERVQGLELIASLKTGDLLLADRGFPSRRIIVAIQGRGADFLMRVRSTGPSVYREVVAFLATESSDTVIDFMPVNGQPACSLRLLRHIMPDGLPTVFLTSLIDQRRHPPGSLIMLYTQRWRIETAFKELKLWHGLERFHARHVDGIAQEVCAMMVFQLLASELEARARNEHGITGEGQNQPAEEPQQLQQLPVRYNRRILGDCVVNLLQAGTQADGDVKREFEYCLFRLWRYRQKPKPGRSFPRERKSPLRGWKGRGTKGKGRP